METSKISVILVLVLGLMVWSAAVSKAAAMGTAWTYQGRLIDANKPAEGLYDFQFKLFDSPSDGNQLGGDINRPDLNAIDGYLTTELDFGSSFFDGDARWLEIGVRPADQNDPNVYTVVEPRQEVTPAPYALQTRGIFVDDSGNVGIGTTNPDELLTLAKPGHGNSAPQLKIKGYYPGSSGGSYLVLGKSRGSEIGADVTTLENDPLGLIDTLGINTGNSEATATRIMFRQDGAAGSTYIPGRIEFYSSDGSSGASERMRVDKNGNVGIGTTSPDAKLEVNGEIRISSDSLSKLKVGRFSSSYPKAYISAEDADQMHLQIGGYTKIAIDSSGNVGIGTTAPGSRLEIKAATLHSDGGLRLTSSINNNQVVTLQDSTPGDQGQIAVKAGGSDKIVLRANGDTFFNGGNVGIGTTSPGAVLDVAGLARVEAVQIMGADVAEKFPMSEEVKPGMVVAIDAEHPGLLCLSRGAYNRCVAGVVSGANGLPSGAVLGNLPGHEAGVPIALSGRVWVYCDATEISIEPGDILTTAERAGYAMAVADRERAHGAVIGKAMTSLGEGKTGLVLSLINLQ